MNICTTQDKDGDQGRPDVGFGGNQSSRADLRRFLNQKNATRDLDVIIDDGSHHPAHQLISFKYLFRNGLKPGGVYIIEDTEMNYWTKGNTYDVPTAFGVNHPNSMINLLKGLVDVVNREYAPEARPFRSEFGKLIDDNVSSVFFGLNCAIVTKMTIAEREKFLFRKYRYPENI
jgi:hypothetical protein